MMSVRISIVRVAVPMYPVRYAVLVRPMGLAVGAGPTYYVIDETGTGRFHERKILKSEHRFVKPAKLADVPAKDRGIFQGFVEGLRKARIR